MSSICSQTLSIPPQSLESFLATFRNYIMKRQGTFGHSQTNLCFSMYEADTHESKINVIGQMNMSMEGVVFLVGVRVQQNEKLVRTLGLNKLKQRIAMANQAKGSNLICYFDERTKTVIMRSVHKMPYFLQQPNHFLALYQQKVRKLLHLIGPNFNTHSASPPNATIMTSSVASSTSQSSFMKNILLIIEIMEYERKNREGCSQNLDFINRKYNNRGSEKIPRELIQKYGKNRSAYQDRLKKIFKGAQSKNEPKNDAKFEPKILRWIKQIEMELDNSWKNDEGMHGMVEKYHIVYKISEDESINAESNQEMAKFRQRNKKKEEMGGSPMFFQEVSQKQEEVIISSILVKKTPINEQSLKSFEIQKKLLAYLRGERCYAINCYYSVEMESIENMKYFYSDYHHKKITDYRSTKLKNYFKVFTSLCEGLLFLRWSGVSHRDLKPDNILLSKNNMPKIIDFGSGCHNRFFHSSVNQHTFLKVINNERKCFLMIVRTNQRYNLRYSGLPKKQYEQHPHFDMYAFGSLMDELLGGDEAKLQMGDLQSEYCKFIVDSCKQPNPIDRPDPKDLYTLIVQILKNKN